MIQKTAERKDTASKNMSENKRKGKQKDTEKKKGVNKES